MKGLLIGSLSATGVASATIPTVALTSSIPYEENRIPKWTISRTISSFSSSKDIASKFKNINCLKEQFGDKEYWGITYQTGNASLEVIQSDDIKSCLIVEYYKQKYTDNKWWGEFKLVWSITGGGKGFVLSFDSKTKNGKLSINSTSYVLSGSFNSNWSVWYQMGYSEITSDFQKFPKHGDTIKQSSQGEYWGFNPTEGNICKYNECHGENKETPIQNSFIWKLSSGSQKIVEWNKDFGSWFDSLFPGHNWSEVKEKLKTLTGSWTQQTST